MVKKIAIFLFILGVAMFPVLTLAQSDAVAPEVTPPDEFIKAKVIEITEEGEQGPPSSRQTYQSFVVELLEGSEKGAQIEIPDTLISGEPFQVGEKVVVIKINTPDESIYQIADRYRLPAIYVILSLFLLAGLALARFRGLMSFVALGFSILILSGYIVPRILAGQNTLFVILSGSVLIALVSLYLAHGFNRRTHVALGSTVITLGIAATLSFLFVKSARLFGLGSEDAYYLQALVIQPIDFRGLLLGGIIIGTLGILDDITTAQTATVEQIKRANPSLSQRELYSRGVKVGHEHIASLINTLVMAYAGASLPLFLLFSMNQSQPLWAILNSEFVAEEIIRTLIGSLALILAVPIATYLASYFFAKYKAEENETSPDYHIH